MKKALLVLSLGCVVLAVGVAARLVLHSAPAAPEAAVPAGAPVALVNGTVIGEPEIGALAARGMERAAAVDQRITQTVMANAAATEFAADATRTLNAARTDLLAQLYAERKMAQLRAAVTDQEVSNYYDKNLTSQEFRKFRLRFVIAKDATDGQAIYVALTGLPGSAEAKAALERFQPLSKSGDGYQLAQEIPYGIGNVVKKMKSGDLLQPMLVREGILIIKIEDVREGERPALKQVADDIRAALASQKLVEQVQQLRKAATIELKS